jgi:hypothetical protein
MPVRDLASRKHIVLAGDSIFDNDIYVMGEPGVLEQMRRSLPPAWSADRVAVDGHCIRDVAGQLSRLPRGATDLIVSVGGNDALKHAHLLDVARSLEQIESLARGPVISFAAEYSALLDRLQALGLRCAVCTIYTAIPFSQPAWRLLAPVAIGFFNAAIMGQADRRGMPVLRLDQVCNEPDDFAAVSPIEPSAKGGQKIVDHILAFLGDDRAASAR